MADLMFLSVFGTKYHDLKSCTPPMFCNSATRASSLLILTLKFSGHDVHLPLVHLLRTVNDVLGYELAGRVLVILPVFGFIPLRDVS